MEQMLLWGSVIQLKYMKQRIYLQIAKDGSKVKVECSLKPKFKSLLKVYSKIPLPTIQIALDLDIADKEFDKSRVVLALTVKSSEPCVNIKQVV